MLPLLLLLQQQRRACAQYRDDGCNPSAYVINDGNAFGADEILAVAKQPAAYCTGPQDGGGHCSSNGWYVANGAYTCQHSEYGGFRTCPCHFKSCDNGQCQCVSSFDDERRVCYAATTLCPACPNQQDTGLAQFRQGCGCVDCALAIHRPFYDANALTLYNLPKTCTELDKEFACGPGHCRVCPVGHYCDDGLKVKPCPPGTYQNKTGQRACRACAVNIYGTYLPHGTDMLDRAVCAPVNGWDKTRLLRCDECTDRETPTTPLPGFTTSLCPPRRPDYGRYTLKRDPDSPSPDCLPCDRCTGKQYARPGEPDQWCVTDRPGGARCVEMYNANPNVKSYKYDALTRVTEWGGEDPREGAMPWVAGRIRTATPHRYTPGSVTGKGLLPHYLACPAAAAVEYTGAYAPRTLEGQGALLNAQEWALDCDPSTTRQCAADHHAVIAGGVEYDPALQTLVLLLECRTCGKNGTGPGGLGTTCICARGTVNLAALSADAELGDGLALLLDRAGSGRGDPQRCIPCLNGVAWRHADGDIRAEALACPAGAGGQPFFRCGGARQHVSAAGQACVECAVSVVAPGEPLCSSEEQQQQRVAPRSIPLLNRTGCAFCPPGTHIALVAPDVYGCVACPEGTFQPEEGQCACLAKRTKCEPGQQLETHFKDVGDALHDYPCAPCAAKCPRGQITIVSPVAHAGNNTCSGSGTNYFACYDGAGSGTTWAATPGQRLMYPTTTGAGVDPGTRAVLEMCDATKLPAHSRFVVRFSRFADTPALLT
jgi:hypothetical protein